jgi:hypothetical protein
MAVYVNARFLHSPCLECSATPTTSATVIAERIGWRYSMNTLKDRVRQIRPEELRAGHH